MLNADSFLYVLGVDPAKWAARFGIEPFTGACYKCGMPQTTSIPFFRGGLRGLIAPVCGCGSKNRPYCVVAAGEGDLLKLLARKRSDPA